MKSFMREPQHVSRQACARRGARFRGLVSAPLAVAQIGAPPMSPVLKAKVTAMIVIEVSPVDGHAPAQSRTFDKRVITMGRSPDADVILPSDQVSRLAIRLVVDGDAMMLDDASENGSTINGVHGWGTRAVEEGDDIRIGPYRLAIRRA
jgi:pSer/pThr/pTyr-binding forkhead associated (FHA) protein